MKSWNWTIYYAGGNRQVAAKGTIHAKTKADALAAVLEYAGDKAAGRHVAISPKRA